MKKKSVILTTILSAAIFLSVFAMNATAEKRVQGAFSSDKSMRSLVKDVIVGQREIKATLQQLTRKIDSVRMCK